MNGFVVPAIAQKELAKLLGEAHKFSRLDLIRNAEGKLSREQWWRLIIEGLHPLIRAGFGGSLMLACLLGGYSVIAKQASPLAIIWIALTAVACGFAWSMVLLSKLATDWWYGQVWQVTGRLNPAAEERGKALVNSSETGSRTKIAYTYTVGGERFLIDEQAYRLLADHFELGYPTVTLYYTPFTRRILSLEIKEFEQLQHSVKTPSLWR